MASGLQIGQCGTTEVPFENDLYVAVDCCHHEHLEMAVPTAGGFLICRKCNAELMELRKVAVPAQPVRTSLKAALWAWLRLGGAVQRPSAS